MPIVIATCAHCAHPIEIDTTNAIILTGHAEGLWRAIRSHYKGGSVLNVRYLAGRMFMSEYVTRQTLNTLALYGLIERPLKRPGGVYRQYMLPRAKQKLAKRA